MNKKTNIRIGTLYFTYIMYIYLLVDCHEFFIGNVQFFNPKSVYLKWNFPLNPHVCLLFGRGRLVGQSFKIFYKAGKFFFHASIGVFVGPQRPDNGAWAEQVRRGGQPELQWRANQPGNIHHQFLQKFPRLTQWLTYIYVDLNDNQEGETMAPIGPLKCNLPPL